MKIPWLGCRHRLHWFRLNAHIPLTQTKKRRERNRKREIYCKKGREIEGDDKDTNEKLTSRRTKNDE